VEVEGCSQLTRVSQPVLHCLGDLHGDPAALLPGLHGARVHVAISRDALLIGQQQLKNTHTHTHTHTHTQEHAVRYGTQSIPLG